MRDYSFSDIGELIGLSKTCTNQIFEKFAFYLKHPQYIDSERSLIKAYMRVYRLEGKEAARKEVARRINLAKEVKKLRKMYLEKD